jgi:3-deoxy-D-manno-octulosonic-acid transferase
MTFADAVFYFPLDWPGPVRRVFDAVAPGLAVIVETEIWPNFLREARRRGVPVVFVNGRISERSYARSRRWQVVAGGFFRRVLGDARLFLMQSEADARRLLALGADSARVEVAGNLKYDVAPPTAGRVVAWLGEQGRANEGRAILVAGSVAEGEEHLVLSAFSKVRDKFPGALLVLAPRKPERFEAAAALAAARGLRLVRRTQLDLSRSLEQGMQVLLLDTVGELAALYQAADVVFVGGSLVAAGGHNVLEPAWFGKVPLFGPHMQNFRDIAAAFLEEVAAIQVASADDLARRWEELLANPAKREAMGRAAQMLLERNQGATERTLERIAGVLAEHWTAHGAVTGRAV